MLSLRPALACAPLLLALGCAGASSNRGTGTQLTVRNELRDPICHLYVSPSRDTDWGDDLLENRVLGPGLEQTFGISNGSWDLRADDCDGRNVYEQRGLQFRSNSRLTLQPR